MIAELIMTVSHVFRDGENRIEIIIQTSKDDLFFRVQKIDVFPSISGAVNIGLTLDADARFGGVNVGDEVYKISLEKPFIGE